MGEPIRLWDLGSSEHLLTVDQTRVMAVCMTPDGASIVSANYDGIIQVWDATDGSEQLAIEAHDGAITALGIVDNQIVSGTGNQIQIWSQKTGKRQQVLTNHRSDILSLCVQHDGQAYATASKDGLVHVWDTHPTTTIATVDEPAQVIAGTRNGNRLVSGRFDGVVQIWKVDTESQANGAISARASATYAPGWPLGGSKRSSELNPDRVIHSIRVADEANIAVVAATSGMLLLDLDSGEWSSARFLRPNAPLPAPVNCVDITASGDRIFSGEDGDVTVWNRQTQEIVETISTGVYVKCLSVAGDGSCMVAGSHRGELAVYESSGERLRKIEKAHEGAIHAVCVTASQRKFASAGEDREIKLWDIDTLTEVKTFRGHTDEVTSVSISEDNQRLISASKDGTVRIWDLVTGIELLTLAAKEPINSVWISGDGATLAAAGGVLKTSGSLHLWRSNHRQLPLTLHGHSRAVNTVRFAEADSRIFSCSAESILWDAGVGSEIVRRRFRTPYSKFFLDSAGRVHGIKDAGKIAVDFVDGSERVILPHELTGKPADIRVRTSGLNNWKSHDDIRRSTKANCLSGNAKFLAAEDERLIRFWDVESGKQIHFMRGHLGDVTALRFSPDSAFLYSASEDGTIKVWDSKTGDLVRTTNAQQGEVRSLDISQDGQRLVSGGEDGTVKVWNLRSR